MLTSVNIEMNGYMGINYIIFCTFFDMFEILLDFKVLNYYLSKNLQPDLTISDIKELSSDNLDNLITMALKG